VREAAGGAHLKLSSVISDIHGVSGRDMLRAIIAGERDPEALAQKARTRMRRKIAQLREALSNGHLLITEILGDWVDEMSLDGHVYWSAHPPGVSYPSDANEVSPGRYIVADYSDPGQVVIFGRAGQVVWRFRPAGAAALNHPSLALPLPNGNILVNDDYNDRVIVISIKTNRIVWQYGHDGVPGRAAGYLDNPDGVDRAPPDSLLMTHAATTGRP